MPFAYDVSFENLAMATFLFKTAVPSGLVCELTLDALMSNKHAANSNVCIGLMMMKE
jgi:hypothetical protein